MAATMSAKSAAATTARARLPSSSAMPICRRIRRARPTDAAGRRRPGRSDAPCGGAPRPSRAPRRGHPHAAGGHDPGTGHRPVVRRDHGHRRQVAEAAPEGVVRLGVSAPTASCTTANSTPASSMACDGRRRQASTKEGAASEATSSTLPGPETRSRAWATEGLASCTTRRQVRPQLPDAQRRLERVDLVDLDADDGGGVGQAGFVEALAAMRVCRRTWGTPHSSRMREKPRVGVVVDHDHRRPAQMELLDGP